MKRLIFDSGPIITLSTTNLLWLLEPLKQRFGGSFAITETVYNELVGHPFEIKRFKFEALQIKELIEKNVLEILPSQPFKERTERILNLANNSFEAHRQPITLVQRGEAETLAACVLANADGIVVDERITRMMLEQPEDLAEMLSHRLHTRVFHNQQAGTEMQRIAGKPKILRSAELVLLAYEAGLLDRFKVRLKNVEYELLDSLLWGVKLHGCAITPEEIENLLRILVPDQAAAAPSSNGKP